MSLVARRRWHIVTLFLVSALGAIGCTEHEVFCPQLVFLSGLVIDLRVPLQSAIYRVRIVADGDTLDLSYDATVTTSAPQCTGECDVHGASISARPFAAAAGQFSIVVNRLGQKIGPSSVVVQVYRGDTVVSEGSFMPQYHVTAPTDGCDDGQSLAQISLDVATALTNRREEQSS